MREGEGASRDVLPVLLVKVRRRPTRCAAAQSPVAEGLGLLHVVNILHVKVHRRPARRAAPRPAVAQGLGGAHGGPAHAPVLWADRGAVREICLGRGAIGGTAEPSPSACPRLPLLPTSRPPPMGLPLPVIHRPPLTPLSSSKLLGCAPPSCPGPATASQPPPSPHPP